MLKSIFRNLIRILVLLLATAVIAGITYAISLTNVGASRFRPEVRHLIFRQFREKR